jgi:hypothetical protein
MYELQFLYNKNLGGKWRTIKEIDYELEKRMKKKTQMRRSSQPKISTIMAILH